MSWLDQKLDRCRFRVHVLENIWDASLVSRGIYLISSRGRKRQMKVRSPELDVWTKIPASLGCRIGRQWHPNPSFCWRNLPAHAKTKTRNNKQTHYSLSIRFGNWVSPPLRLFFTRSAHCSGSIGDQQASFSS